jgi:hypothetical protein
MSERMTNKKFCTVDGEFLKACEKTGTKPTSRQASKWRRKFGRAYKFRNSSN